jgi:RNA binding exosome subunit
MSFVERIEARAYSRATEVSSRVKEALIRVFPEEVHPELAITVTKTEGHNQNPIDVLVAVLKGRKDCARAFAFLLGQLSSDDVDHLTDSLEQRLDDSCRLFLRIDKQEAYLGRLRLAQGPDVVSVQVHMRNYPRCSAVDVNRYIMDIVGRSVQ